MDSAGPISHLHFPQNFLSSSMTNYITVQNNRIVNHALHPGTIIANTFIPQQLKYFYYEITVQVGYSISHLNPL